MIIYLVVVNELLKKILNMRVFLHTLILLFCFLLNSEVSGQVLIKFSMEKVSPEVQIQGMDCGYEYLKQDSLGSLNVIKPTEGEAFLKLSYIDTTFFPDCKIRIGRKIISQYTDGLKFRRCIILNSQVEKKMLVYVVDMNFFIRDSLVFSDRISWSTENQADSGMVWKCGTLHAKNGSLNPDYQEFDSVELIFKFQFEEKKPFVFYLDDVQLELFRIAGVEEARINNLNVYPNPCKDRLIIHSETIWNKAGLYDFNGRLLKSFEPDDALPDGGLDVSELPAGIFMLQLQLRDGTQARARVVKGR